jgi:aspartate aminotransferase
MFVFPDVIGLLERGPWTRTVELAGWLLDHAGVAVVPGEAFDAPGHLRLCFAVSPDTLDTATDRLVEHLSRGGTPA